MWYGEGENHVDVVGVNSVHICLQLAGHSYESMNGVDTVKASLARIGSQSPSLESKVPEIGMTRTRTLSQ